MKGMKNYFKTKLSHLKTINIANEFVYNEKYDVIKT